MKPARQTFGVTRIHSSNARFLIREYLSGSVDVENGTPVSVRKPGKPEVIRRRQVTINVVDHLYHVAL